MSARQHFSFKKRFGQNFLINKNVIIKIVSAIPNEYSAVFEVGPGHGALTEYLLKKKESVTAIEIDTECCEILENKFSGYDNFAMVNADILTYQLPVSSCVIGNLPYNISIKILEKIVLNPIAYGIFMLQKEVANRVSGKDYCRLSLFIKAVYDVGKVVDVSAKDFFPKPKVESQVIFLKPHGKYMCDLTKLTHVTRVIFSTPRKKLNWLKKGYPKIASALEQFIDLNSRIETVKPEIVYKIVNLL